MSDGRGFLSRLFGARTSGSAKLWGAEVDETEGQPEVSQGVAALHARDWTKLAALYTKRTPSDRYHFVQGLGFLSKLECALPPSASRELANIGVGLRVGWAWRYRGFGVGSTVSESGAQNMLRLLGDAAEAIDQLGANADSAALAYGIRAHMGLGGNRDALAYCLDALAKTGEVNIFAARNHLLFVAAKWFGSREEIHSAARDYAKLAPNPAWLALPAFAHAEDMAYRLGMTDDVGERDAARVYFKSGRSYPSELERLDDEFWAAFAKSGSKMDFAERLFAHNALGFLLYQKGMNKRLARHLEPIGRNLLLQPWSYFRRPTLDELRKQAGLKRL